VKVQYPGLELAVAHDLATIRCLFPSPSPPNTHKIPNLKGRETDMWRD